MQSLVNEAPLYMFEIGLARSDVTAVCHAKVNMNVLLDTRAVCIIIRNLETYIVDA